MGSLRISCLSRPVSNAIALAFVLFALFALFASIPTIAAAQTDASGSTIYRLADSSTYQEGCFDPCLCPILAEQPVLGSFRLRPVAGQSGFEAYRVEDLFWKVPGMGDGLRITGSGHYTIGSPGSIPVRQHRLELDLRFGELPAQHFDSGWVVGPSLPRIQITLSVHGMSCYDRVFVIDAAPVPASEIASYVLVEGSDFQRGCFDPCDCLLGPEQPMTGSFSLLPLSSNPLFSDFAMVGVHWTIEGNGYSLADPNIIGQGAYRVGGEFAAQQRMEAELEIGDLPPASFDSGLVVGGSGFPELLDVEIAQHGKVCFDTVMRVRAARRPAPEPAVATSLVAGIAGIAALGARRRRIVGCGRLRFGRTEARVSDA